MLCAVCFQNNKTIHIKIYASASRFKFQDERNSHYVTCLIYCYELLYFLKNIFLNNLYSFTFRSIFQVFFSLFIIISYAVH